MNKTMKDDVVQVSGLTVGTSATIGCVLGFVQAMPMLPYASLAETFMTTASGMCQGGAIAAGTVAALGVAGWAGHKLSDLFGWKSEGVPHDILMLSSALFAAGGAGASGIAMVVAQDASLQDFANMFTFAVSPLALAATTIGIPKAILTGMNFIGKMFEHTFGD